MPTVSPDAMNAMPGMSPGWMILIHVFIVIEIALGALPAYLAYKTSRHNKRALQALNGKDDHQPLP